MLNLHPITVVITCYKEGILLREALESLLNQSYQNWKCILVKDASDSEETGNICKEFEKIPKFTVLWNQQNIGSSGSRNRAISVAEENAIILCVDGDDRLPVNSLLIMAGAFASDPSLDFIYGDVQEFGTSCQLLRCGSLSVENILLSQSVPNPSPFKRHVWEKVGGYAQELSWGNEDWEFWLSVFEMDFHSRYIPETLYEWRIHKGNKHTSYNHRWPQICQFMYQKHKATYDRFGKGADFLGAGWKRAAFYYYQQRDFKKALEYAEEALKLLPHDDQMKKLRLRCKIPPALLDTARAAKRIFKYFVGDSNS